MRLNMMSNLLPADNNQTTLELRHFIEAGHVLFDPNDRYPIWKEEHRPELEKKIIEHYWDRQIGFETFGKFKRKLNTKMREIMPRYIKIWDTTQYEYNPIENYSMKEGSEDKTKDDSTSSDTSKIKNVEKFLDTPQNEISNLDDHLTSVTDTDNTGSNESARRSEGTHVHTAWRNGNIGVTTSQQMIQAERDITIDVDMMIIDDLKTLFLGVL